MVGILYKALDFKKNGISRSWSKKKQINRSFSNARKEPTKRATSNANSENSIGSASQSKKVSKKSSY